MGSEIHSELFSKKRHFWTKTIIVFWWKSQILAEKGIFRHFSTSKITNVVRKPYFLRFQDFNRVLWDRMGSKWGFIGYIRELNLEIIELNLSLVYIWSSWSLFDILSKTKSQIWLIFQFGKASNALVHPKSIYSREVILERYLKISQRVSGLSHQRFSFSKISFFVRVWVNR